MNTPPSFVMSSLYVAAGGGLGTWLRYLVGRLWGVSGVTTSFPFATLTVNVLGSFAMGLLAGSLARFGSHGEGWRLLLGVGLLGGFTTFSAFSLELVNMINRGAWGVAGSYMALSLAGGIFGLFAGLAVVRGLV